MDEVSNSRRGTSPALPPDRVIDGKYELRGVLGEGGTGIVYDALRQSDGAAVALKVIHPHLAGDRQIRGRFQREAAILKRLEGDHICPILELGEVAASKDGGDSLLYMALPKVVGPTLERVLQTERPIAVERALDVMLQICAALRTAHAQGVIHRDLKPANVILEGGSKVVVVDFGMSKIVTGAGVSTGTLTGTTNLTAHNMVFGTPEYMSPEQARGDELDARCDVYAAGIMLYEMLTGAPPFTGATPLNVLTEHLTGELMPPSKRAGGGRVTSALESVVLHALARERDERYPSASALAAAIMHARARPDDVDSLRPSAFATSPAGMEPFAVTMPAIGDASELDPHSAGRAIVNDISSDTLLATAPAPGVQGSLTPRPRSSPALSKSPSSAPRGRVTTKPPTSGPGSGSGGRGSSSSSSPTIPEHDPSSRLWIVLWVLAGLVSIGIGVYFALRH